MTLKEMIKQKFSNPKAITLERYKAAKFMLIISSFLFFINFYLVWAKFYLNFFTNTLGIMYIILLLSFVFYVYFFTKNMLIEKIQNYFFIIILIMLFLIFSFFALPVIIDEWFNWVLKFISLILNYV